MVLAEGNVFQNVKNPIDTTRAGKLFASPNASANAACSSTVGHTCQTNGFGSSGTLTGTDTGLLANFKGKNVASATTYEVAKSVKDTAGFGKI